jgi:uncharacterized membrane protein
LKEPGPAPIDNRQPGVSLERSRTKPLLVAGVAAFITLVLLVLWPGSFEDKYLLICSGTCAQRPAHTYYMNGQKLPVEARMVGIFGGYLLTWLWLWFYGRSRAGRLSSLPINLALATMFGVMVLDGLNATFYDFRWPHLYQPQNWLRIVTGTLSGVGLAGLVHPLYNFTIWKFPWEVQTFKNWRELGWALIPSLFLMGLVFTGWGWLFWPIATLVVLGGLWMLTIFNLMIYVTLTHRENRYRNIYDLLVPVSIAFLISLAEFAATATLRQNLIGPAF